MLFVHLQLVVYAFKEYGFDDIYYAHIDVVAVSDQASNTRQVRFDFLYVVFINKHIEISLKGKSSSVITKQIGYN